jgi:hypothetical protein
MVALVELTFLMVKYYIGSGVRLKTRLNYLFYSRSRRSGCSACYFKYKNFYNSKSYI